MTTTERDDINKYLTWQNVFKVIAFIWAILWFIQEQLSKDTARDYQTESINKNVTELNTSVKDLKNEIKASNEALQGRVNNLEKKVDILSYEVEILKSRNQ